MNLKVIFIDVNFSSLENEEVGSVPPTCNSLCHGMSSDRPRCSKRI